MLDLTLDIDPSNDINGHIRANVGLLRTPTRGPNESIFFLVYFLVGQFWFQLPCNLLPYDHVSNTQNNTAPTSQILHHFATVLDDA